MMSVGMDYAVLPVRLLFSIPHAPAYADSRSVHPIVGIVRFHRHPGGACTISTDNKKKELSNHGIDGITFLHKWCTYISEAEFGLAFVEKPVLEAEEKLGPGHTFVKLLRRRLLLKRRADQLC